MPQMKPNWTEVPPRDWSEEQAHHTAQEIRRLRGPRSAQWLADRTKELGCHVSRAVISDLENGRRRYVTTAEVMMLARALDTAPVALMYSGPYSDTIRALPTLETTKIWAAQWFSGLASGVDADGSGGLVLMPIADAMNMDSNLKELERARRAQRLDKVRLERLEDLNRMRASESASSEETAELVAEIADLQRDIDELRALGSRDLHAERVEQLTGRRRGRASDGG